MPINNWLHLWNASSVIAKGIKRSVLSKSCKGEGPSVMLVFMSGEERDDHPAACGCAHGQRVDKINRQDSDLCHYVVLEVGVN